MDTKVARNTNEPDFATAYYFLEGLNEIGIDYLFCNFGTDHAPIIEEMAHRQASAARRCRTSSAARTRTPPPTWPAATPS